MVRLLNKIILSGMDFNPSTASQLHLTKMNWFQFFILIINWFLSVRDINTLLMYVCNVFIIEIFHSLKYFNNNNNNNNRNVLWTKIWFTKQSDVSHTACRLHWVKIDQSNMEHCCLFVSVHKNMIEIEVIEVIEK